MGYIGIKHGAGVSIPTIQNFKKAIVAIESIACVVEAKRIRKIYRYISIYRDRSQISWLKNSPKCKKGR